MRKGNLILDVICIVFSIISFVLAIIDANVSAACGWFCAILWNAKFLMLENYKED